MMPCLTVLMQCAVVCSACCRNQHLMHGLRVIQDVVCSVKTGQDHVIDMTTDASWLNITAKV